MVKLQNKKAELQYYKEYAQKLTGEGSELSENIFNLFFNTVGAIEGNGSRLLDVGCGSGIYGKRLAKRGYNVTGIDLCPEMVELANNRNPIRGFRALVGDIEDKDLFHENTFAVVFFGQMLHHLPDISKTMKNSHRWLKKGGKMMIVEPNGSNPVNMLGKSCGRFLSLLSHKLKQEIGTENERSLSFREILFHISQNNMHVVKKTSIHFSFDFFYQRSFLLHWLMKIREWLYLFVSKASPEMYRGRGLFIVAEKV